MTLWFSQCDSEEYPKNSKETKKTFLDIMSSVLPKDLMNQITSYEITQFGMSKL